jgi:hypothetical protein
MRIPFISNNLELKYFDRETSRHHSDSTQSSFGLGLMFLLSQRGENEFCERKLFRLYCAKVEET